MMCPDHVPCIEPIDANWESDTVYLVGSGF